MRLGLGLGLPYRARAQAGGGPAPEPPVISISSGSGYAGSVYASDIAGQWTADGVAIAGATGTSWTMTVADEGKVIRCGNSNAIQMWTLNDIPVEYRTNGGWWSSRRGVQVSADNKVTGVTDQFGVRDVVNSVAAYQPTFSGNLFEFGISPNNFILQVTGGPYAPAWWILGMHFRLGVDTRANSFNGLIGNNNTSQTVPTRVMLDNTSINLLAGTVWTGLASVNAGAYSTAILPLSTSLVELRSDPSSATWSIGCSNGNTGRGWCGQIRDVLALGIEPTGDLLQRIQGCMAHQIGIADKLPADHPYKTSAPQVTA